MDLGALSEEGVEEFGTCLLSCANYKEALQVRSSRAWHATHRRSGWTRCWLGRCWSREG